MTPTHPHSSVFASPELDRLFLQSYDRLLAFSRKNGRNLGDAEDFVHEAYLRSRRAWSGERASNERPEAYFFRALRWALADARRRKARVSVLDPAEMDVRVRACGTDGLASDLSLSPEDHDLFRSLMSGRTKHELCRELQVSPGALAVRICRAKKKLEACLGLHTVA